MSLKHIKSKIPSEDRQTNPPKPWYEVVNTDHKSRTTDSSLAYYEQLMRHDWHSKVRHRFRQRGWDS